MQHTELRKKTHRSDSQPSLIASKKNPVTGLTSATLIKGKMPISGLRPGQFLFPLEGSLKNVKCRLKRGSLKKGRKSELGTRDCRASRQFSPPQYREILSGGIVSPQDLRRSSDVWNSKLQTIALGTFARNTLCSPLNMKSLGRISRGSLTHEKRKRSKGCTHFEGLASGSLSARAKGRVCELATTNFQRRCGSLRNLNEFGITRKKVPVLNVAAGQKKAKI